MPDEDILRGVPDSSCADRAPCDSAPWSPVLRLSRIWPRGHRPQQPKWSGQPPDSPARSGPARRTTASFMPWLSSSSMTRMSASYRRWSRSCPRMVLVLEAAHACRSDAYSDAASSTVAQSNASAARRIRSIRSGMRSPRCTSQTSPSPQPQQRPWLILVDGVAPTSVLVTWTSATHFAPRRR